MRLRAVGRTHLIILLVYLLSAALLTWPTATHIATHLPGDWLTRHGHAHLSAPAHRNDYSLFRLGRDYLQRALTMGWSIPVGFTVSHGQAIKPREALRASSGEYSCC